MLTNFLFVLSKYSDIFTTLIIELSGMILA